MANKYVEYRTYPDWVHHELLNWSRWCWMGATPVPDHERCQSIECNYSRITEEGDKAERRILLNIQNAQIVQKAFEKMPPLQRKILIIEYPKRNLLAKGRDVAARALRLSRRSYDTLLYNAACTIQISFEGAK